MSLIPMARRTPPQEHDRPYGRRHRAEEPRSALQSARAPAGAGSAEASLSSGPAAVISRRAADRLRAGHVWVYASDVVEVVDAEAAPVPGLLPVVDGRGLALGTALYSPASQIALRLVSQGAIATVRAWLDLLEARVRRAVAKRRELLAEAGEGTGACRLIFSEGDALPGLVADRYGDLVLIQILTRGLDRAEVRETLTCVLVEELQPATIVERADPRIREMEQMSMPAMQVLFAREPDTPRLQTQFHINGLAFGYDAASGQKTGAFLDQRLNYAAAARHAHGEALDVCTYQGGFALHLAQNCPRVTGVDVSRAALEVAERNLAANRERLRSAEVDWMEANAFDLLREWSDAGVQYDTIVLDPPAFAKSRRAAEEALRGYKELNLRSLKMLRPGGTLVTCSCSHHVSLADFTAVVAAAAGDAKRRLRLVERRGAAPDHPVVLNIPETEYLKCLICAVEPLD